MKYLLKFVVPITLVLGLATFLIAQPRGPRMHSVIEKGELNLMPSISSPDVETEVSISVVGDQRVITSNGIPNHKTGQFPNRGNPNRISVQKQTFKVPANPEIANEITPMRHNFGVAINGVLFDPGAGEFYDGAPGWQYEPLSGTIALGIDMSHAHVQPTGKYHYHGLPTGLLDKVKLQLGTHSPLIGWAADGFPIYALYGYSYADDANSEIKKLTSSYQLKEGDRPGGDHPGGVYDGTFVADYEFVAGSGDLDECNGRECVTPDFPEGTYAYFLSEAWPVIPRNYRGTPSEDFAGGPHGPRGSQSGIGPGGRRGPRGFGPPTGRPRGDGPRPSREPY